MRKSSVLVLFYTLIAGAGGFFLRRYELATAFEPLTGLAIRNAAASSWLISLTVFFFITIISFAAYITSKYNSHENFEEAFGTFSIRYPLAFVPVWIVWIAGTVIHHLNLMASGALQTVDICFLVLSTAAALSVTFFAVEMFQDSQHKSLYSLSVAPILFLCFWLVLLYRQNAANPILLDFVYLCLAIVLSTLSYYYTAGFLYGKPAPGKAIVSYCGTVYFCGIALADNLGMGILMIIAAILATGAINLYLLVRHLEWRGTETGSYT